MMCGTLRGGRLHVSADILNIFREAQELALHLSARRGPLPTLDDYEMTYDAEEDFLEDFFSTDIVALLKRMEERGS